MNKKKANTKKTIAEFVLSTGYVVPIEFENISGSMRHLSQAIIGELALATAIKHGWNKGLNAMKSEISDCVIRLSEETKENLIKGLIWNDVLKVWKKFEKKHRGKK